MLHDCEYIFEPSEKFKPEGKMLGLNWSFSSVHRHIDTVYSEGYWLVWNKSPPKQILINEKIVFS